MASRRQLALVPAVLNYAPKVGPATSDYSAPVPATAWAAAGLAAAMLATMTAKPSSLTSAARADEVATEEATEAPVAASEKDLRAGHKIDKGVNREGDSEDYAVGLVEIPVSEVGSSASCIFCGIFDGHGGTSCAEYLATNLAENMTKSLIDKKKISSKNCALTLKPVIRAGFKKTEQDWTEQAKEDKDYAGSTACCALLYGPDQDEKLQLFVANLGDSRAIIGKSSGDALRLTKHHRLSVPAERARIKAATEERKKIGAPNSEIIDDGEQWRVCVRRSYGKVALPVSRAFGDFDFKPDLISAEPDVSSHAVDGDEDEVLIIASDGVFEVISDEDAVKIVLESLNQDEESLSEEERALDETPAVRASRKLIEAAKDNGSEDDRSAVVVHLKKCL